MKRNLPDNVTYACHGFNLGPLPAPTGQHSKLILDVYAAMLDRSFVLATSAIHIITMVPACLSGLTEAKVTLNSLIHPSILDV